MGITRFLKKQTTTNKQTHKQQQNPVAFPRPNRGVLGSFPPPGCPGPARTARISRTAATRNLSQSPLKFSKALRPRLHGGRHPNGKRPRRHRSFLHSVSSPALWGWGEVLRRVALIRGTSHREPPPSSRSARSRGPGRGQPRARVPRSRRNDSGRSGPRRLYGLARPRASLARPGRQGARWLAPPTLSARLDRVRHIGCRSRRGQRFLLCLRCALQVPAA